MFKKFIDNLKLQHLSMRGSSLYLMQAPLWLAVPVSLFRGQFLKSAALAVVVGCLCYGAGLTRSYYLQKRDELLLGKAPAEIRDERRTAMGFISLAVFILFIMVSRRFVLMGVFAAALAAVGYYLNYLTEAKPEYEEDEEWIPNPEDEHLSPTQRGMISDARHYLERIRTAINRLAASEEDEYLTSRLRQILRRAGVLVEALSKDGSQIRNARAFLVVHLRELADISQTYSCATSWEKAQSRQQFTALLDTIHAQLSAQHDAISEAEQRRLSIQMDVLQEQLEHRHKDE